VILVTGATGFVGKHLIDELGGNGIDFRCLSRKPFPCRDSVVADLADKSALTAACSGIDTIFHCAGHAHAFASFSGSAAALHWQVNFAGTRNLVEAAGAAGVKRFVFLSSVKAMAEPGECCADEDFPGQPATAYGQAKRAAEEVVVDTGRRDGMHVVNLRLAMVYGSGGRGNLERMGRLVERGLFPPLPETGNRRSLVHVDDVVAVMRLVADDDRANGRTYIVASSEAPSGRELFDALRSTLGMPRCSWAVPEWLLRAMATGADGLEAIVKRRMPFDSEVLERLLGSAWYSPARIERDLGWRARVSLAAGLAEMLGK
jgi:nucleoside-diphosphate-sugar epimerase